MKKFVLLLMLLSSNFILAQSSQDLIRDGNSLYSDKKYNQAEIKYRKALEVNNEYKAKFNLGDALFKQGNYEEAAQRFRDITEKAVDSKTLSSAYHNLGNSLLNSKKFDESIAAYKSALKNNPKDNDTRYNLEYAKKMLEVQKQQQQQQQQNKDKNQQNQNSKDQNNDSQQQDQQNKNQNNKDNQNADNKQNDKQNQNKDKQDPKDGQGKDSDKEGDKNQPTQMTKNQISKQDAERMLNAAMNEEKEVQKKVRKQKGSAAKIKKNW